MVKKIKRYDCRQLEKALKNQGVQEDEIKEQLENLESIGKWAEEERNEIRLKIKKSK
jgi:hypothetical protein